MGVEYDLQVRTTYDWRNGLLPNVHCYKQLKLQADLREEVRTPHRALAMVGALGVLTFYT